MSRNVLNQTKMDQRLDQVKAIFLLVLVTAGSLGAGVITSAANQELTVMSLNNLTDMTASAQATTEELDLGPAEQAFHADPAFTGDEWDAYVQARTASQNALHAQTLEKVDHELRRTWIPWMKPRMEQAGERFRSTIAGNGHEMEFALALFHARAACKAGPEQYLASWTPETAPSPMLQVSLAPAELNGGQLVYELYPELIAAGVAHLCP